MRIDIQTSGFILTDGLREHAKRRLQFALSWANHDVHKIAMRLSDINGPRGGSDKRCQIQVRLSGGQDVVIEDTEADLYVAIDRAADRADHAVARRLERLREHHHERLNGAETTDAKVAQDAARSPVQ